MKRNKNKVRGDEFGIFNLFIFVYLYIIIIIQNINTKKMFTT